MGSFQLWLESTLSSAEPVATFMRTDWGWPAMESVHFIGLTLLFGSIAVWDLRLLGMAKRVPVAAFHRLVPFAVLGFTINIASGSTFLMTEPNQYIYNPAFHFKILFVALVILKAVRWRAFADEVMSGTVKILATASLVCWAGATIAGRLLAYTYTRLDALR